MIGHEDAGAILTEMVEIVRTFRSAGQRSRARSLTGTTIGVLQHLRRGEARLGAVAENLVVSASVASRAVESLESDGMVRRRTDTRDARAFLVSITDRGRAHLDERESRFIEAFAEALNGWSPEEAKQAIGILARLGGHLGEVIETLEARAVSSDHARDHRLTTPDTVTTTNNESEVFG